MKLLIKTLKPRNPFVAAGLQRAAGSHRIDTGAKRQQASRDLRRELQCENLRLRHSP